MVGLQILIFSCCLLVVSLCCNSSSSWMLVVFSLFMLDRLSIICVCGSVRVCSSFGLCLVVWKMVSLLFMVSSSLFFCMEYVSGIVGFLVFFLRVCGMVYGCISLVMVLSSIGGRKGLCIQVWMLVVLFFCLCVLLFLVVSMMMGVNLQVGICFILCMKDRLFRLGMLRLEMIRLYLWLFSFFSVFRLLVVFLI